MLAVKLELSIWFRSLYHIFLFVSMIGEIAGVKTDQSESEKDSKSRLLTPMLNLDNILKQNCIA